MYRILDEVGQPLQQAEEKLDIGGGISWRCWMWWASGLSYIGNLANQSNLEHLWKWQNPLCPSHAGRASAIQSRFEQTSVKPRQQFIPITACTSTTEEVDATARKVSSIQQVTKWKRSFLLADSNSYSWIWIYHAYVASGVVGHLLNSNPAAFSVNLPSAAQNCSSIHLAWTCVKDITAQVLLKVCLN